MNRILPGLWALFFAFATIGCIMWLDPLPDTPENLRLGVVTISLKENADAKAWVSAEKARGTVEGASDFWTQACGISLVHTAHLEKDAQALGVPYRAINNSMIDELQDRFQHDNYITVVFAAELRRGEKSSNYIGGTAKYPWGPRAAILMAGPYKKIFAHELGHYFGLEHVAEDSWAETRENDPWNLMFPGDAGDALMSRYNLQRVQCAEAKKYLLGYDSLRPLCRPDSENSELSEANCPSLGGFWSDGAGG